MASILDHCRGAATRSYDAGAILISQGVTSGQIFVLIEGRAIVDRDNMEVAVVDEPGAIFGEMSVLLGIPHTATVRTASPVRTYVFDHADDFLRSHPAIAFHLARLLAHRLNAATAYLVDLKRQFEGQSDHLGMVGDVLESLMHQPDDRFTPVAERPADPRL